MRYNKRVAVLPMVTAVFLAGPSLAQDDSPRALEEITVTAAYREQGLQDVPVSVSAVTGELITSGAMQKAEDIQFRVPNFSVTETGIATNIFIRGIGSGINQGFEQSVGTYIDGVHYGRAQMVRAPFLDLQRVEVLRGPQSILFGKNSVAGALNITTARPTEEFEGSFFAGYEFEDEETIIEGVVSGAFSDTVRGRLAARYRDHLGYMDNATTGFNEPARDDIVVRGTLEFDITEDVMATFKAEMSEFDVFGRHIEIVNESPAAGGPFQGLQYNQILAGFFGADSSVSNVVRDDVRSSNGDFSFNESESFVLTLDWAIGEHDLKSITALTNFEYDESCDCDFTGANVFFADLQEEYEQFSQEFRLSSPLRDDWDYIVGVYYQTSDHTYNDQIIVPANSVLVPAINLSAPGFGDLVAGTQAARIANVDNDVLSGFAQVSWHVSDTFTVQLGGRITQDDRSGDRTLGIELIDGSPLPAQQVPAPLVYANAFGISSTNLAALGPQGQFFISQLGALPVSGERDKSKFSHELKGIWDVNDDVMLYATWANGFKSGSFDFRANNRNFYPDMATSFEFDDEEATNYELGGKFVLGGGTAEINAAAFITEFEDLQISIFDGILGFNVGNAAAADIVGLEIDGRWAAGEYLTISGGFAITDFEFTDFRNGQCYFGRTPDVDLDGDGTPELCDYSGESNQMLSDFQGNVSFDWLYPMANSWVLNARLDVFYTSKYDASATYDPLLVQDAYTKTDLRLALAADDGAWEVAVLGKNLGDERVLSFGGDTPLAGSTFGAKSNYAFYGQGRTVTLQALFRF
ncbi:MAG: TonB-dependent receptor [Woeseiaceae bacterium]|nr:TonB-dependent receptor [Woeseiaceae bacterium]